MASSLFLNLNLFNSLSLSRTIKKAADAMLRESRSRSFEDEYEPLSSLGSGGAATVARCVHRASGAVVAAKRIPLSSSSSSTSSSSSSSARQAALVELASLILLQGAPHAIELLDSIEEKADHKAAAAAGEGEGQGEVVETTNCVFLVTRLCAGGELFDSIVSKEHYCEREAALLVRSLASFLAAAHRVGVVHRDLKPENVMLLAKSSSPPSSKSSSPMTKAATAAAAAAAAWPAPAAAPPSSSLQRLPSRLCREASDVAAMLSACPPMRRPSFSGGERMINRRRTTGTGTAAREVAFLEREGQAEEEEEFPVVSSAESDSTASIEGRRRCSCLEREGIRVIDLGCAALFDPSCLVSSSADAAPSPFSSTSTSSSSSKNPGSLKKMIGTPYYAAPEVLPHSPFPLKGAASDVWSLGVIAFVLLSGRPPFGGRDDAEVARRVAVGRFSFKGKAWDGVSDAAKAAISSMLEKDPSRRATAAQVLESEWLSLSASKEKEAERETESAAAVVPAIAAAVNSTSSSSAAAANNSRLRARIRAFAAESKLHAAAALALTRTVSGVEGAAQLREMILLQEEASEEEEEEEESGGEEGEESSDGDGDGDGGESLRPRLGGGGAAVVPSVRRKQPPPSSSYRCSAPGGLEVEKKKNNNGKGSAPVTPRAAAAAVASKGASKSLGGLLRRTLTLGASSAAAAAALAAAAAALPPGCRECETCGGIVIESEEEEGEEEEKEGAEAVLEGLLERGSGGSSGSGSGGGRGSQPPCSTLLRTQTTVGAERAAELAFAALDADGDGWLCVEDLLRAGREEGEGEGGEGEAGGEGGQGGHGEKKNEKRKGNGGCSSSLLMTREEALACVAEASAFNADASQPGKVDFDGFKRVLWRRG